MKKIIAVVVFATLIVTSAAPLSAQKSGKRIVNSPITDEFARFGTVDASANANGARIRWQMVEEKGTAGFMVYRQTEKGLEPVENSFKPGAIGKFQNIAAYGESYEVFDARGTVGTSYVVEAWKLNSDRRVLSETVSAKFSSDVAAAPRSNGSLSKETPGLTKELSENYSPLPPNLNVHRQVVAQAGAKIGVRKDGLYRVTRTELQNAGFNVNSDSANWRLFLEGNEQAIIVGAGDQYIEFYGRGLDTVESDTRMYYLIADAVAGKRVQTKILRNFGGTVISNNYPIAAEKKLRNFYIYDILNGDLENYFGTIVTTSPATVPINLTGIDFSVGGNVTFTLKVQGFSLTPHDTRVILNGSNLGNITGTHHERMSRVYTIPLSLLVEGNNSLELTSMAGGDLTMFDTATFSYARKFQADQNRIEFPTRGIRKANVGNFSSANIRVFETTYDGNLAQVTNLPIVQNGPTHTVTMPSSKAGVFYAVEDSAVLQAATITANVGSTLSTTNNAANLIIISNGAPDFMTASETWANYRRGQGFTVKVVDVNDIFDEFGYGVLSSDAVKAFLNYAKDNWTTSPNYVLILGDGAYDSRNYEGGGYWNMVPPKLFDTDYSEAPSDEALADFNNDGLAELAIGRIPARTVQQITTAFNKTTAFETPAMQDLNRGAVFAYDLPIGFDFEAMSHLLREQLPPTIPAPFVGRGDPNAQTTAVNEINSGSGRFIVNWSGHGTTGAWGSSPPLINVNTVPQFTNTNPTVFTMLTCLNGYFINTGDSLSELLVKSNSGGAAAAWASTSLTTPPPQLVMGLRFYEQINQGNIKRLGDLVRDAKAQLTEDGADVRLSWALLGDPMMKIRP